MAVWAIKGAIWIVILVVPHDREVLFCPEWLEKVRVRWKWASAASAKLPELRPPDNNHNDTDDNNNRKKTTLFNQLMQGQIKGTSRLQIQLEIESIQADIGSEEGLAMNRKV